MPRRGVTQTRTFNYGTPPGANLLSATNPENGTVTYTYNTNNLVATKTDAKNQQTQYVYDTNNRVTQIRHYGVAGGGEVVPGRYTEPAAGFDHGKNGRHLRTRLRTAHMFPS